MATDAQGSGELRLVVLVILGAALLSAQTNLDFHEGQIGQAPPGWSVFRGNGHDARLTEECAKPGALCAVLEYKGEGEPAGFGNLMQSFAPGALQNRKVRFKASVRVPAAAGCRAQMWFRTDLPGNAPGFFDNMGARPITSPDWNSYEIIGAVAADAVRVNIGLMVFGACKAFLGDVSLEDLGQFEEPFRDPSLRAEDVPKIEWLKKNAIAIRSIDPDDDDFADLMPLKKAIGDARIVQLGEQSHGDGATFYAKERLIRFLHEQMGFDVLAWESGFYDCEEMNKALAGDMPILEAAQQGVFGIWTRGGLMKPLFEYARSTLKTERPLRQTGFDIQFTRGTSQPFNDMLAGLGADIASPEDGQTVRKMIGAMAQPKYEPSKAERETGRAAVERIVESLRRKDMRSLAKSFENLAALEEMKVMGLPPRDRMPPEFSLRDIKMGENLIWLANEWYAGKKIIVWAASMHVAHNVARIDTRMPQLSYKDYRTMGQVVHEKLAAAVYTIAFTAYQGKAANPQSAPRALAPPDPESLETFFHAAGKPYAFVDFRALPADHWMRRPLVARPLGYAQMLSDWTGNFDAMIFTDVMFPNTVAGTVPDGVKTKR